jgi:hypothetical protein
MSWTKIIAKCILVNIRFAKYLKKFLFWLIMYSVLRQFHIPFQSEFSTACDPVIHLSPYSIFSLPKGNTAAGCLRLLLSLPATSIFPSITCSGIHNCENCPQRPRRIARHISQHKCIELYAKGATCSNNNLLCLGDHIRTEESRRSRGRVEERKKQR